MVSGKSFSIAESTLPPQRQSPRRAKPTIGEPSQANSGVESAGRSLRKAQQEFLSASKEDNGSAVSTFAGSDIRVLRSGVFPAVGRDAARVMLNSDHVKTTFERAGGALSSSGDLAYEYGEFATPRNGHVERGSYVAVWKTTPEGVWKLAGRLAESHAGEAAGVAAWGKS